MIRHGRLDVSTRFLILRASRWFATGLGIPVLVLLLVDRGLTLQQIGIGFAAQGLMVFLLELPTGGLADAIGRRPVLLVASVIEIGAVALLLLADGPLPLAAAFALMGIYRALESGPLDAWFVDTAEAEAAERGTELDLEKALGRGGAAVGVAIAAGSLLAAILVKWPPVDSVSPLATPFVVAIGFRVVDLIGIGALMSEDRRAVDGKAFARSAREVPTIVATTVRLVRSNGVLAALVGVEFLWGVGMASFETLFPPRLAEVTGDVESAAALLGPLSAAAWLASAAGGLLAGRLAKRTGTAIASMIYHGLQAAAVIGLALLGGTAAVAIFYLITLACHGAANPLYQAQLHGQADSWNRTTVVSAASMAAHPGGVLGAILLGSLADAYSVSTAMIVGSAALFATVPLYVPSLRHSRS